MSVVVTADVHGKLSAEDIRQVELLLRLETEYLDQARYADWLALYTADCTYWVPAFPGQTDPDNELSLFYETRELMQLRIDRITSGTAHSLSTPLRCSHVCGDHLVTSISNAAQSLEISTRFLMHESQGDRMRSFAGSCHYELFNDGSGFLIRKKRVDLVNCDGVFEPIQVFI